MANVFDQFDEQTTNTASPQGGANPFDQFDEVQKTQPQQPQQAPVEQPQTEAEEAVADAPTLEDTSIGDRLGVLWEGITGERSSEPVQSANTYNTQQDSVPNQSVDEASQQRNLARLDQMAQGLSFGFSDEVDGLVRSQLGDETYEEARDAARQRLESGAQEMGAAEAAVYQVLGSLPTGTALFGAAGRATQAANLTGRGATAARVGTTAAEGALAGSGFSDADTVGGQVQDALIGAGTGIAAEGAAKLAVQGFKAARNFVRPEVEANEILRNRLLAAQADRTAGAADPELEAESFRQELQDLIAGTGDNASLAQLPQFREIAESSTRLRSVDDSLVGEQANANQRAVDEILEGRPSQVLDDDGLPTGQVEDDVLEGGVDPTIPAEGTDLVNRPADTVAGTQIDESLAIPETGAASVGSNLESESYSGVLGLDRYAGASRAQGNAQAADLYEAGYARGDTIKAENGEDYTNLRTELGQLSGASEVQSALREGRDNAININTALGREGEPSPIQIMDEASKVLGSRLSNLETGQSSAAISGLKRQLDGLIGEYAPEVLQGRAAARQGQRAADNIATGQTVLDADIDSLDASLQSLSVARGGDITPDQEQALLGAGRDIRNRIGNPTTATRDSKTNRVLSETQVENYNRLATGDPRGTDLEGLISNEAMVNRAYELSKRTPQNVLDDLKSKAPSLFRDSSALASVYTFVTNPSAIMVGLASTRLGQAAVSRLPKQKVAKEVQNQLFKVGATEADIDNLLSGNFDGIDEETLLKIGSYIARRAQTLPINESVTEANDSNLVTQPIQ